MLVAPSQCTPEQVDSFCTLYTQVIKKKGTKVQAPFDVKQRLLENELLYNRVCPQAKV